MSDRPPHILVCGVNFDAHPEGVCTGRLVRALLDSGAEVVVVCARQKSRLDLKHPGLRLVPVGVGMRHPQWLWRIVARLCGRLPSHQYPWTRRVAKLELEAMPDVVYARAWPYASLVAGHALARRLDKPLWLHFSDPFPPPPNTEESAEVMEGLAQVAKDAVGATFTNQQAADYQLRFLPERPTGWARVLSHVAPPARTFGPPKNDSCFVYLGSFHASRPADPLVAGFARYLERAPEARLHFVGTKPKQVEGLIERLGVRRSVSIEPFTQDVPGWQQRASVLVAVDWMLGTPVYLLTKVVEALVVDRPLLLITQPGSPGAELAQSCADTVACVFSTAPGAIAEGLAQAAGMARSPGNYAARQSLMEPFRADQIARHCLVMMADALGSRDR